jgi:NAD-dependent dihydropyrimidine dehydrogenase PreA subunit
MFNAYATTTLTFNKELCNNCIMCSTVCPHAVFERINGSVNMVLPENCMECGACQLNCPTGAISVKSGTGCATLMMYQALTGKKQAECGCC